MGQSCPECGGHPVVEEKEITFLQAASQFRSEASAKPAPASPRKPARRRKRKKGGLMLFVVGWFVFLVLLVGLVSFLRQNEGSGSGSGGSVTEAAEDQRALNEAWQKCSEQVADFLKETMPERRVKAVHDPTETLRRMVRYGGVSLRIDDEEERKWKRFQPIDIDGQRAYEGVMEFADGRRAEFVFLPEADGEFGIDWPNLVRYSEHPWSLFLSGSAPPTGEFRLLARRRAGSSGQVGDVTSIVLFAPDPWDPERLGPRSPEVEVAPGSRTARMLEAAFRLREDESGAFGSKLQQEDPRSMVRIRAKLRRHDPGGEGESARFEIDEILGCHWISVEDPGVDVPDE
ncbi:hypothetical protein [Haloferula sp. A504]|uniref:hypothetical protein n=1 Tax=Haloferula sp. A504 TaxID=3373601 RepID=UPI0037C0119C